MAVSISQISTLDKASLDLYKRQLRDRLKSMDAKSRNIVLSRIKDIPELEDISRDPTLTELKQATAIQTGTKPSSWMSNLPTQLQSSIKNTQLPSATQQAILQDTQQFEANKTQPKTWFQQNLPLASQLAGYASTGLGVIGQVSQQFNQAVDRGISKLPGGEQFLTQSSTPINLPAPLQSLYNTVQRSNVNKVLGLPEKPTAAGTLNAVAPFITPGGIGKGAKFVAGLTEKEALAMGEKAAMNALKAEAKAAVKSAAKKVTGEGVELAGKEVAKTAETVIPEKPILPKAETPLGGQPPIEPPKPPKPVATEPPDDIVTRLNKAIHDPQNNIIKEADARLVAEQRNKNINAYNNKFNELITNHPSMSLEEASKIATGEMKGKLERVRLKPGNLFTPQERAELVLKIKEKYPNSKSYDYLSTMEAFTKYMDEGILSDKIGVKGGSQKTRLEYVFGKSFVEALDVAKNKMDSRYGSGKFIYEPTGELAFEQAPYNPKTGTGNVADAFSAKYKPVEYTTAPSKNIELDTELLKIELAKNPEVSTWVNLPKGTVGKQLSILPPTGMQRALKTLNTMGINAVDTLNLPRAFITSFDISAAGRQGLQLSVAHPVSAAKSFAKMMKALVSANGTKEANEYVKSILYRAGERAKELYIAPIEIKQGMKGLSQAEETFMSRFAQKIPGIKQSQRAYITYLNTIRTDVFEQGMKQLEKIGATQKDYDALAKLINSASGRGAFPASWQSTAPVLNALLFSPRYAWSRVEYPYRAVKALASGNPVLRKEAAREIASFLGFGASILGLYKAFGGKLETDPRSAEFGKIKIGESRIDIWAGYLQYIRTISRFAMSTTKTTGGNINPQNQGETTVQFLQSKESPLMGLIIDILRRESYGGEEMAMTGESLSNQAINRLVPLFAQDLVEAIQENGVLQGIAPGALSALGVGVITYTDALSRLKNQQSQKIFGLDYDEVGTQLGKSSQSIIDNLPDVKSSIEKQEAQYAKTAAGKQDIYLRYRNQTRAIEKQYLDDINKASAEYKDTKNGSVYRDKINSAAASRRTAYNTLNNNTDYKLITDRMNQPLSQEQINEMNPNDVARIQYNKLLYGSDMYDQYGNYDFDLADKRRGEFLQQYGQDAMNYINEYYGLKDEQMPVEYRLLQRAREILKPYWAITDYVWSDNPQLKEIWDSIASLDEREQLKVLRSLPSEQSIPILHKRKQIALLQKKMKANNPRMATVLKMFYS